MRLWLDSQMGTVMDVSGLKYYNWTNLGIAWTFIFEMIPTYPIAQKRGIEYRCL